MNRAKSRFPALTSRCPGCRHSHARCATVFHERRRGRRGGLSKCQEFDVIRFRSLDLRQQWWSSLTLADIPIKSRIQCIQCKSNYMVKCLLVQTHVDGIVKNSDGYIASRLRSQGNPIGPQIIIILYLICQFSTLSPVCQARTWSPRKSQKKVLWLDQTNPPTND
jgi:hypothetical protein